ncbi:cyclic dof factor 1-like isoform X2 [Typha latifolia]|uniref:cyclic dof factor 1-like isoform X2 n=1 Tax=Typha latifolia TaxID=4733 RepID=UPI003C2BC390
MGILRHSPMVGRVVVVKRSSWDLRARLDLGVLFGRWVLLDLDWKFEDVGMCSSSLESKDNEPAPSSKDQDHELPDSEEKSELPMPAATEEPSEKNSVAVHEEESTDTKNPKDKAPNKPEKILPCPRCNSMDTKFCYYNNYNVNQPRHFCKNCQRYWTAGGTMRNVPVGAGRRKSKISTSYHRHIVTSTSSLQGVMEPVRPPLLKPNGTVLSFGSDSPLLNLADQTAKNCSTNGFHIAEACKEEKPSTGALGSNTSEEATKTNKNCQQIPIPLPLPFLNSNAWAYPWRSHPALCSPTFAIPFYPAAGYWGATVPAPWSIPWPSSAATSPTSIRKGAVNSPVTLGKHSRDVGDDLDEKNTRERRIWAPKTLRINDPDEAAKSSIWSMVGTKNDKERLLSAFQSKLESKNHTARSSQILHANPAALSRFLGFQESS